MAYGVRVPCVLFAVTALFVLGANGTGFMESPMSQTISAGQEAVFRCGHPTADAIRWKVNGSLVRRSNLTDGVGLDADGLVEILTITGRLDYNGTMVECVARFDDSPEQVSNPALLIVTGTGFLTSPLSVNVTVGTETVFHCEHQIASQFSWMINGTALNSKDRLDLRGSFRASTSGSVGTLTVTALSQYSSTRIECIAFLNDQSRERTPFALLLIQGPLAAVRSLTKVGSAISWEPPFSLDLTGVDPDIVYCVDVYNITCGGRDLVSSDCSVTDTNCTSLSDGYLYEYIVTPRSNVEGAQNGTASQPLKDTLPTFSMLSSGLSLANSDSLSIYQIGLSYNSVVPLPSFYILSLEALDGLSNLDHVEVSATEIQPNLLLSVTGLESRRLWDCTIFAYGCQEHSLLSTLLSTHDFQGISISSPSAGVVRVNGTFVKESPSTGVLVIVSGDSEVSYHLRSRDGSGSHVVTISGLAGGDYIVSVFVVEENGLPFERAAIIPEHLSVETNTVEPPPPTIVYSLESNSTGVCVKCNFLATDASECIAVVHRNLTNIESRLSRKFIRSGDTASGCIEGVNLEDYQVGVVGGRLLESGPPRSSNLTVLIAVLVPIVVILAVIVIVLLIIVKVSYDKYRNHHGPGDAEKTQNYYTTHTSVPALPTENPRSPLVVQSVERSVEIYDTVTDVPPDSPPPLTPPSRISNDAAQVSTMSTSVSESSTEDGNTPLNSTVDVEPKTSSPGDVSQTSTSIADSAEQSGISPLYSQVEVKSQSISVPPVDDEPVVYSEVMKTQSANNQLYAMVNPKKTTIDTYPDDLTKVVYSEICPHGVEQQTQITSATIATIPPPPPFTVDSIVAALLPVASKWQAIGEAFPLSQKRLDDIETTEGNEQCLQEMIEAYMLRRDLNHTWDEIVDVLKKIKEDSLAEKIFKSHVAPYDPTISSQPQLPGSGSCKEESVSNFHEVSTDGGNLDRSSPVLPHQQTEPPTSVLSEGEAKPDKEESLPTAVPTPETHHDVNCESGKSFKRRVATDGDSGVSDGRESSSTLEREDDMLSQTMDADSSSIERAPSDVEKVTTPVETHQVTAKPAQVVHEQSQDEYESQVHLRVPSSSDESQRDTVKMLESEGKPSHGDPVASTSEVNSGLVTPKQVVTQVDYETPPCQHTQGATPLDHNSAEFVTVVRKLVWNGEKEEHRPYSEAAIHGGLPPNMLDLDGQKNFLVEKASSSTLVEGQPKSLVQLQLMKENLKLSGINVDEVSKHSCTSDVGKKGEPSTPITPDSAYISERAEHDQSADATTPTLADTTSSTPPILADTTTVTPPR